MTATSDLSVVVQGPVYRVPDARLGRNFTEHCLQSARNALPGCELILSTWEGEDVGGLDYDVLVQSPDPGPCDYMIPAARNVNRQLVSSRAGLLRATRPYAVKLRSDTMIEFPAFLDYRHHYLERGKGARLFQSKIIASSLGTANFRETRSFFALSDFFFFGLTPDLLTLFDLPPCAWPEGAPAHSSPVVTEQYLAVGAMRAAGLKVDLVGPWPGSYRHYFKYWLAWERFLFANFTLDHPSHLGLLMTRRLYVHDVGYPVRSVERLYHQHCCRRGRLPLALRDYLGVWGRYLLPPPY